MFRKSKSRKTPPPRAKHPGLRPIRESPTNMETPPLATSPTMTDTPPENEATPTAAAAVEAQVDPEIAEKEALLAAKEAFLAEKETFSMEDLRAGRNIIMNIAVRGTICRIGIEFYLVPGERRSRAHAVVDFDEKIRFRDAEGKVQDIKGLAMWMKNTGDDFDGSLHVRYIIADRPFVEPLARFYFPLANTDLPVAEHVSTIDVINVLQGLRGDLPAIHRTTLTEFTFRLRNKRLLGSRDAIAQWMVRLSMAGLVGWHYLSQDVENVEYIGRQAVSGRGFDTMIDQNFASDMKRDEWGILNVVVKVSPVARAIWRPDTYRVMKHAGKDLPYVKDENDKVICEDKWVPAPADV
ncbi:hypothetical protein ACHAPT_010408 [Fusarium lateritium]